MEKKTVQLKVGDKVTPVKDVGYGHEGKVGTITREKTSSKVWYVKYDDGEEHYYPEGDLTLVEEPKEPKGIPDKEKKAIEQTIELWTWLAETGKMKPDWPQWVTNGGKYPEPRFSCFLCEFSNVIYMDELGGSRCKTACPYGKKHGFCATEGFPYEHWEDAAEGSEEKKKYAGEFLEQLKALLPAEPKKGKAPKTPEDIPCQITITFQEFCPDGRVEVSVDMMEKGKPSTVHRRLQCLHAGDAINIMDDLFIKPPA